MPPGTQPAEREHRLPPSLEITVDHAEAVLAAVRGGAGRLELCASLADGGLTPSVGLVSWSRAATTLPLHAMVRPRAGNFVYSPAELDVMKRDIHAMRQAGADGVVLGVLTQDGQIDLLATRALIAAARPMRAVFHRAFDLAANLTEALEVVIGSGADILLTSGGAPTLEQGLPRVSELAAQARGRVEIMGGSGVRLGNAQQLWACTALDTLHASLRSPWPRARPHDATGGATMGARDTEELYTVREEDVRALSALLAPRNVQPPESRS